MTPFTPPPGFDRLLAEAHSRLVTPYLLTVTGDARPHCSVVQPDWDQAAGRVIVAAPSRWAESEKAGHATVTLLWPPVDVGGYRLILDGTATTVATGPAPQLAITPSRAVLHRPERVGKPGSPCQADCVQLIP